MYILLIIFTITAFLTAAVIQNIREKNRRIRSMLAQYGKKRKDLADIIDRLDSVSTLYELRKDSIPENSLVDDITWNDLDMDSTFAIADHTDSYVGEQCLYFKLHDLSADKADLADLEDRIRLFDTDETKRDNVRKKLFLLGKALPDYSVPTVMENLAAYRLSRPWIYYLLSAFLIASGLCAALCLNFAALVVFIAVYFVNMTVHIVMMSKLDMNISVLGSIGKMISTADALNKEVPDLDPEADEFISPLVKAAKNTAFLQNNRASSCTDEFSLLRSYMLGPFMLDFIVYDRVLSRLCAKQPECIKTYRFVGEADCAIALSSFRRSIKNYCTPEFSDKDSFAFKAVTNPLLKNAVPNDIEFKRNIIITGSNASGKSTFVRSVAINLILGQTVHTCTAEKAVIPKCCVMTSMAVRDDILSGESYYVREIRYLKRMIDMCSHDKLLFLAIDEILKGTNTRERLAASKAVMSYFHKKRCMLTVATHDLEIAKAFETACDNYHFSEAVGSDDVVFDYILHKGISNSSNAIKLLAAMHFPKEITDEAANLLR